MKSAGFSPLTCVARLAKAGIPPNPVHAGSSILAGLGSALVYLDLTVFTLEAWHAVAGICVPLAPADRPVPARVRDAVVHTALAVGTHISSLALAGVIGLFAEAGRAVTLYISATEAPGAELDLRLAVAHVTLADELSGARGGWGT